MKGSRHRIRNNHKLAHTSAVGVGGGSPHKDLSARPGERVRGPGPARRDKFGAGGTFYSGLRNKASSPRYRSTQEVGPVCGGTIQRRMRYGNAIATVAVFWGGRERASP